MDKIIEKIELTLINTIYDINGKAITVRDAFKYKKNCEF